MSSFEQTMIGRTRKCYILSFLEIDPLVPEKMFEWFLPLIGVAAILVLDPDATNTLPFPLHMEAPHKIWLKMAKRIQRKVSFYFDKKMALGQGQ